MSDPNKTEDNGRNPDGTFKEGNPGGPGRPKKKSFRDYFTEEEEAKLIKKIKAELDGETRPDIIKMTIEHIFGKPKQALVGGGEEDEPIKHTFQWKEPSPSTTPQDAGQKISTPQ